MNSKLYYSSIEFSYTETHSDYNHFEGGFVYCFVVAENSEEVFSRIEHALGLQHLKINVVEFILPYDLRTHWDTKELTAHYRKLSKKASISKNVVFDDFYSYKRKNIE